MTDANRAQMSFGRAPQSEEPFDQDNGVTPKYGVTDHGDIIDLATGQPIDVAREATLQKELAATRRQTAQREERRRLVAMRAAKIVIREDFKHLEDVPGSSRSMVGKDELVAAIVKGIRLVDAHDERLEDIEADGM
ncbi:hypothetical protein SEA_RASPUTIA_99 [Microbacterium phage Rasputia]|nr:hypothetical protein SEA_RASPUTIA_99 [Microbacterium phage Rasputia]